MVWMLLSGMLRAVRGIRSVFVWASDDLGEGQGWNCSSCRSGFCVYKVPWWWISNTDLAIEKVPVGDALCDAVLLVMSNTNITLLHYLGTSFITIHIHIHIHEWI